MLQKEFGGTTTPLYLPGSVIQPAWAFEVRSTVITVSVVGINDFIINKLKGRWTSGGRRAGEKGIAQISLNGFNFIAVSGTTLSSVILKFYNFQVGNVPLEDWLPR